MFGRHRRELDLLARSRQDPGRVMEISLSGDPLPPADQDPDELARGIRELTRPCPTISAQAAEVMEFAHKNPDQVLASGESNPVDAVDPDRVARTLRQATPIDGFVQLGEQSIRDSQEARRLRAAKHSGRTIMTVEPTGGADMPVPDNDPNEVMRGVLALTQLPEHEK